MNTSLDLKLDRRDLDYLRQHCDSSFAGRQRRKRDQYIGDVIVIVISVLAVAAAVFLFS